MGNSEVQIASITIDNLDYFNSLFDEMPTFIWHSNQKGERHFFNKSWLNLTGRRLEEETIYGWLSNIHPNDKEHVIEVYQHSVSQAKPYEMEYRILNNFGKYRTVLEYGKPYIGPDELLIGYLGSCYDITDYKKTERALKKESAEIYSSLYENSHEVILLIDPDTADIVDANLAACKFYGYPKDKLINKKIAEINLLTIEDVLHKIKLVMEGKQKHFEFKHQLSNGEIRDVESYSGTIFAHGKQLIYIMIHDVTERYKSEEAVKIAYAELNQIFNTTGNGMRVIDTDYNIIRINDTMLKKLNLNLREALGSKCYEVFPGELCHSNQCPLERIKQGASRVEFEVEKTLNTGQKTPCLITATPFTKPGGELIGIVEDFRDISERKKNEERIKYIAYHDPLTDLPNRLLFTDTLQNSLNRLEEEKTDQMLAVLFIDLDEFKYINDTYGHTIGDNVLVNVAKRLKSLVSNGTVARIGGDEFTILLPNIQSPEEAKIIGKKVLNAFLEPFHVNGIEIFITLSIGISMYPSDGNDPDTIVKHADIAMYQAKEIGKNTCQFFAANNIDEYLKRLNLENRLRRAIERNELQLYYQPQISLNSGQIIGAEALLRWHSPELGEVSPAEFIPLAEEVSLINEIGEWVLLTACKQCLEWSHEDLPPLKIAVNMSVRQLQQSNLVEKIEEVLSKTGLEPTNLEIEITESIALKNIDYNIRVLKKLKELGIQISLDDFGTGYSSLSYLKMLPIDVLKIDKSFVHHLSDHKNRAIAAAIISMAHSLDFKVVAEGVETEEQLTFLKEQHCDIYQGFYYSKPVPAEEFKRLLTQALMK